MGRVENLRRFIMTYVPEAVEEKPWESDIVECGILLVDAADWIRIKEIKHPTMGVLYKYEVHLRSGHWAFSTSGSPCLAACDALCRAVYLQYTGGGERG